MSLARNIKKRFTYADYLQWDDSVRVELINGEVYEMTPAPLRRHQEILMKLALEIGNFLKGKKDCRLYPAPFDVRLPDKGDNDIDITTVVQPDISVICDAKKLDERGCLGPPDLVVEIVSPETAAKDMREKLTLYEKHGVKEYWIADPRSETVEVYSLKRGLPWEKTLLSKTVYYEVHGIFGPGSTVTSPLLTAFEARTEEVFARPF